MTTAGLAAVAQGAREILVAAGVAARLQQAWPGNDATGVQVADDRYRWLLGRCWAPGPLMVFTGLNPSTANALTEDQTSRRFRGFAAREGCGGYLAVNLCAYRTTYPSGLAALAVAEAAGPCNDDVINLAVTAEAAGPVVCAWGAGAAAWRPAAERARVVTGLLTRWGVPCHCLGVTSGGQPAHPARLRRDAALQPWLLPERQNQ